MDAIVYGAQRCTVFHCLKVCERKVWNDKNVNICVPISILVISEKSICKYLYRNP